MILRSSAKLLLLSSWFLAICSNHVLAQMDEEEMEIEAWFDLIRYMLGLSFVIFAIFSLLYRPIATRFFLRRFDRPDEIEEINGVVLSCEEMQGFVNNYKLQVHYTLADTPPPGGVTPTTLFWNANSSNEWNRTGTRHEEAPFH
jgi:hypothetical protein